MTNKQLYDILSKELKRLINTDYYFSFSSHTKTNGSFYCIFIQDNYDVIYFKYFHITDKDLNDKIKDLIYFISQLIQNEQNNKEKTRN